MKRKPLARKTALKAKTGFKPPTKEALKRRTTVAKARKNTKASKLRRSKGIWSTNTADKYFSKWIRQRDKKCMKCGITENLTCSHYYRRAISATRYCPKNNITLCGACHAEWEGPKEAYTDFMVKLLGEVEFITLAKKAGQTVKRADAVAEWKLLYNDNLLKSTND